MRVLTLHGVGLHCRKARVTMAKQLALVVEDDKDEAILFAKALETAGFETEIIRAGDTALARLSVVVPDVVLLDLNLPHVSGGEILHQIRADPRLGETRVIIVTGAPQRAETLHNEADMVFIKPVGFNQLCDMAARLAPETSSSE